MCAAALFYDYGKWTAVANHSGWQTDNLLSLRVYDFKEWLGESSEVPFVGSSHHTCHVPNFSLQRFAATRRCFGGMVIAWAAVLFTRFRWEDAARTPGADVVALNHRRAAAGGFPKCLTICSKGRLRRAISFQSNNGPGKPSTSWASPSGSGS